MKTCITLLFLLCTSLAGATNYYISPTGNDANSGTSQAQAWRTIARLNQSLFAFQPGDQVLFQRGATFRGRITFGSSGTANSPVIIGAYGSGAQPIISGSDVVTGWTVHQGNIWKAPLATPVKHLFYNGQLMTLARYPNTGWLRNDVGTSTSINDDALTQPAGYWNGAEVVQRGSGWSFDISQVTNYVPGHLDFTDMYMSRDTMHWGYFLRNKLSELDAPGEWYHDVNAGMLYFRAPANADPNSQLVEASVRDRGFWMWLGYHHTVVDGLHFKHQFERAVFVDDAHHITIRNCTFEDLDLGIFSYGHHNTYRSNQFTRTYKTAVTMLDNNSIAELNHFQDIAMQIGLGETNWGYMGIRLAGPNNVIRGNHMSTVGYIGISVDGNNIVERNFVQYALSLLNEGPGIGMENADGVVVRDNIVLDTQGSLEGSAPNSPTYWIAADGISFGNISVKNTLIENNTVANCTNSGIHVDHTMVLTGNQIKNNVLFNNHIQLSMSDWSNYNTPGASPPYFVPSFNTVYSGNVMYCLTKDQLCMSQMHCWSGTPVNFGSFSNNFYFNPYNEVSIYQQINPSSQRKYYHLERWQSELGQDAGSTRSLQRLNNYSVTNVIGANMVTNGTFNTNLNNWFGWPSQGQMTLDQNQLDGGALKVQFSNNATYNSFLLQQSDQQAVQNGEWYRLKFSYKGGVIGELKTEFKGQTQQVVPQSIFSRLMPLDSERREAELIFQSNLSDMTYIQLVNSYIHPTYWLDNVELHKVQVQAMDPSLSHILVYNADSSSNTFNLIDCWTDVHGVQFTGSITLAPFESTVLYRTCTTTPNTLTASVMLSGPMNWTTHRMTKSMNIPTSEPYTALGMPNISQALSVSQDSIVDWVLLELLDNFLQPVERRACLVRTNGQIITPNGSTALPFSQPLTGKYLVIRHRNHLPAMYGDPIAPGANIDMTLPNAPLFGFEGMRTDGIKRALWAGNVAWDDMLKYTGGQNDRDPILNAIGGIHPTTIVPGYLLGDVNLDGVVKYTGANNDRDMILQGIDPSVPTSIRDAQVP